MDVREKLVELLDEVACKADSEQCQKCVKQDCVHCAYENVADHLITKGVTLQNWVSTDDRFPEENGIYLTFNKKKQYEFHMFQTGKRMWQGIWEEDGVTHWMPLPQPPKGE